MGKTFKHLKIVNDLDVTNLLLNAKTWEIVNCVRRKHKMLPKYGLLTY